MIEQKLFNRILQVLPLLTVDIIVEKDGKYLLVKRNNVPLKGMFYLVGGRVLKNEKLVTAAKRKLKEETGLVAKELKFYGYSEGIFNYSHAVSIVFLCTNFTGEIKLDSQSSEYKWSTILPLKWIRTK